MLPNGANQYWRINKIKSTRTRGMHVPSGGFQSHVDAANLFPLQIPHGKERQCIPPSFHLFCHFVIFFCFFPYKYYLGY